MDKKKLLGYGIGGGIVILLIILGIIFIPNKKVVISFDSDGAGKVESQTIKKGESIKLPTVTREGFTLDGWFDNNKKIDEKTTFTKDTKLIAKWIKEEATTYTITFDSQGGSTVEDLVVECDKELVLPDNPTKKGYTFVNWLDEEENVVNNNTKLACEDITLTAKWEKEETTKKEEKEVKTDTNTPAKVETKEEVKTETKIEKPKETTPTKNYKCPDGYTLNGTKCTMEKTPTQGCDKQTEGKYNNKCYNVNDYKEAQCKVYTGNTSPHGGNPILVDGIVIGSGSSMKCVAEKLSVAPSACESNGGTIVNGSSCYKYVQTTTASAACSNYSGYEYIVGNALYDPSIGRTNVKTGCYKGTALHNICEEGFTLSGSKCIKTVDATLE